MKNILSKIKKWYLAIPNKKRLIEIITGSLSIPMMITVIFVNLNNILFDIKKMGIKKKIKNSYIIAKLRNKKNPE